VRSDDHKWECTLKVNEKGRLEVPLGFRRDWMKSPSIPLDKAADMFDAALHSITDPDLEPKNGNYQVVVGERRRNIFRKYKGVDYRACPMQQAYVDIRYRVTTRAGQGRYFSIAADIADPDGSLRETIRGRIHELDLAMRCFNVQGYYPHLIDDETINALRALAEITRRMAKVQLSTTPEGSYALNVPPSFRRLTVMLIEWFNAKFPWFLIAKHDKSREALAAPWVGDFLTDVLTRLYPKVGRETVDQWIDLVLGAQNDLR